MRYRWTALLLVLLTACGGGGGGGSAGLVGERVEVLASWSGAEADRFGLVLREFERRTGAVVRYTSARNRVPDELAARLAAGDPPDVAVLPQPGLLRELAQAGDLVPLDAPTRALVRDTFPAAFQELGSSAGRLYGVWFKAADKSLVWYDVATFERLGEVAPGDLDGLMALADRLAVAGVPAFSASAQDGWTLTDWFENLYLREAGGQAYDDLAAHRTPWTAPSVVAALAQLERLLAPEHLAGGTAGALSTGFEDSVAAVFARPPRAAMVVEADFVAGVVTSRTDAELGIDADVFAFPAGASGEPGLVAGGDVAVLTRPSEAGAALMRFLATPEAAEPWARAGGFLSPNLLLDLDAYGDPVARAVARQVLEAGDGLHFDLSDLQPAAFGSAESVGLRAELRELLVHRDPVRTAERLEAAADRAFAGAS